VTMERPKEETDVARLPQVMTSMDEEGSSVSKVPSMFNSPLRSRVECGAETSPVASAGMAIPPKEPNPVEFRSGYRGVSWNRRMKAWLAFWSEGKNRRSKTFNAKVMGFEKARAAAIDFLKKKKQLLQQLDPNFNDFDDYDYDDQTSNGFPPSGASSFDELADIHSTSTSDTATPSATPCSSDGQENLVCANCGSTAAPLPANGNHLHTSTGVGILARIVAENFQGRSTNCLYCTNPQTP